MRVKVIKDSGEYRKGQVLVIDDKLAYKLIQDGIAINTKDMTSEDINGKSRIIRTNFLSRR